MTTRYFNGTRDGSPYHAQVTRCHADDWLEVKIIIFDRRTGEPHYAFERSVSGFESRGYRAAVRAVIANPDAF